MSILSSQCKGKVEYWVEFQGGVLPGFTEEQVKARLSRQIRIDVLDKLFKLQEYTLKKYHNQHEAESLTRVLRTAGLNCSWREVECFPDNGEMLKKREEEKEESKESESTNEWWVAACIAVCIIVFIVYIASSLSARWALLVGSALCLFVLECFKKKLNLEKRSASNGMQTCYSMYSFIFLASLVFTVFNFMLSSDSYEANKEQIEFESQTAILKDKIDRSSSPALLWDNVESFRRKEHVLVDFTGSLRLDTRSLLGDLLQSRGIFSKPARTNDLTPYIEHEESLYYIDTIDSIDPKTILELINSKDDDRIVFSGIVKGERSLSKSGFLDKPEWKIHVTNFKNLQSAGRKIFQLLPSAMKEDSFWKLNTWSDSFMKCIANIEKARKNSNPFADTHFLYYLDYLQSIPISRWKIKVNDIMETTESLDLSGFASVNNMKQIRNELFKALFNYAKRNRFVMLSCEYGKIQFRVICWHKKEYKTSTEEIKGVVAQLEMFKGKTITLSGRFLIIDDEEPRVVVLASEIEEGARIFRYTSDIPDIHFSHISNN